MQSLGFLGLVFDTGPSRVIGMLLECPCAPPPFSLFLLWVHEAILTKPRDRQVPHIIYRDYMGGRAC